MNVPLCRPSISEREHVLVREVLESGWLTHGPMNERFESAFADFIGVKHAITVNSCTSGLQLSLEAYGVRGEVICPSFSWVASANAVVTAGATPVFADIKAEDRALNIEHVRSLIGPNTEAIMVVHYGGQSAEIDGFSRLCQSEGLLLIEDSAETIGGTYMGQKTGSFGIGNFSFFPTKNITVGEGGMVTTDDHRVARKIRALAAHGLDSSTYDRESEGKPWYKDASAAGYNYRMSNILAAVGVAQMERIEALNEKRRRRARQLTDAMRDISWISPPMELPDRRHVYQTYSVLLKRGIDRTHLLKYLREQGVGASVHFSPPIHRQQYYKMQHGEDQLPVTDDVSKRIVSLPMYPDIGEDEIEFIARTVRGWNGR